MIYFFTAMADADGTGDIILDDDDELITQTQTQSSNSLKMSRLEYFWIIVFQWDLELPTPFQMYTKRDGGFPTTWLEGALNENMRKMKLRLKSLPGEKYSLYCKIEKGKNTTKKVIY